MILAPVPLVPAVLRDALTRRGVDASRAEAAARGLAPIALTVDDVSSAERDGLARAAQERGIACLTGDGWVLLAGSIAQLAGLARAGSARVDAAFAAALGRTLGGLAEPAGAWEMERGTLSLERPVLVGIVNVTPDSFSDGGRYRDPAAAARHAEELLAAGAGMLDLGAESTRPGRPAPVPAAEEWARLEPVLRDLVRRVPRVPISVDTVKADTARRALEAGAWAINDVSGLRLDPEIADACRAAGAGLVLMHSRGGFGEMATYDHATYRDVVGDVLRELDASVAEAERRGVARGAIVVDPGLGFAKRPEHNVALLQRLLVFQALGRPVMVGPSRKRFLGTITGQAPLDRDPATAAACLAAHARGARLFRVHDVAAVRDALAVGHAIEAA